MAFLTINIDSFAQMRESRKSNEPDPCHAAVVAEMAGADGISVQMRRSKRGIKERDLYLLKGIVKSKFIVEMPPTDELIDKVLEVKPTMVILAADHADFDSPLAPIDFKSVDLNYSDLSARFAGMGVNVCFFVEPNIDDIKGAAKANAGAVFINCASYSTARELDIAQRELDRIDSAVTAAAKAGLNIFCGRGLNYRNIQPLTELDAIDEFLIGYSICSRAMLTGLEDAVKDMKTEIKKVGRR